MPPEGADEGGRDATAAVARRDGEVVDVELAPLLLELRKLVARERAHDAVALDRHQRGENSDPRSRARQAGPGRAAP
jgi:hypothetical protein